MNKVCAYCGKPGELTREHIWPASILQRVSPDSMRYIESAEKVILTDPVIKDVCRTCNGGVLSELDAYGCGLFDNQFRHPPVPGRPTIFTYDFNRLSRWLLKISYNSARSSKHSDAEVLASYVPDIVNGTTPDITICLDLIEPALAESETASGIALVEMVNPTNLRTCRIALGDGHVPTMHILRLVAIQGYWFGLIVPTARVHSLAERRAEEDAILARWRNIAVLPRDASSMELSSLGNDVIEMNQDALLAKKHLFEPAMRELEKRRSPK